MTTQDPTTNYGWDLPTDGGSSGSWGTMLNSIIGDDATGIDAVLQAVSDVADAALPVAGGTMTGELVTLTQTFTYSNAGNITGTAALDLDVANFFYATVTGDVVISLSNVPSGKAVFGILEITNGGAHATTFASAWKWAGGTAPTLTTSGVDVISFYTRDGGTTVRAALVQLDSQ
jgi:hypothetical protein